MPTRQIGALLFATGVIFAAGPSAARSSSAARAFMMEQPCPTTGRTRYPCPGWVIDHVQALRCGGADHPSNMQWQTVQAAKEKDRWELAGCRPSRKPLK